MGHCIIPLNTLQGIGLLEGTQLLCMQVLEELYGKPVLWYMEGHSVAAVQLFEEFLGLKTTHFGFGSPDYATHAMDGGAFRNDEKCALSPHLTIIEH